MAGRPTQFGVSEDEGDDVIEAALAMPKNQVDGFHFHSISNNIDSNLHVDVVKLYFKKAKGWNENHRFPLK
ncbi:diaminopimelate decarboxylase, partial [Staphylococcus aureus]